MGNIGIPELLLVLFLVLLIFGAKRLPQIARSIGKSLKEFKTGMKSTLEDDSDEGGPAG